MCINAWAKSCASDARRRCAADFAHPTQLKEAVAANGASQVTSISWLRAKGPPSLRVRSADSGSGWWLVAERAGRGIARTQIAYAVRDASAHRCGDRTAAGGNAFVYRFICASPSPPAGRRSEEHTSELQ